jgi:hypothetical protein
MSAYSSEDDEVQQYGRSTKSIIKELCGYDPVNAKEDQRLAHNCYLKLIGVLNKRIKITSLITEETAELVLEHIDFILTAKELLEQRANDLVFEDNFNTKVLEIAKSGQFTYDKLKQICSKYETSDGMKQHDERVAETYEYFTERDFRKEEAQAIAFALAFYTGSKSEAINRAGSLLARQGNGTALSQIAKGDIVDAGIILYYLVRGLSNIPYYWGEVSRACQLTDEELQCYKPGYLVTWLQFSSSKKGNTPPKHFRNRNTFFIIYSLTGRSIRDFSNFKGEDEVLFLPHSTFIVVDHQITFQGEQHSIHMRQVELDLSQWSVLWVDDHIFDEKWENKEHMEKAAARDLNRNIHFIPKSNTSNAVSFLKSPFGQRLKNRDNFRIVSDMNRDNEHPPNTAGAQLIKRVRELGFNNKCLIFSGAKDVAHKELKKILSKREDVDVFATLKVDSLLKFICFEN